MMDVGCEMEGRVRKSGSDGEWAPGGKGKGRKKKKKRTWKLHQPRVLPTRSCLSDLLSLDGSPVLEHREAPWERSAPSPQVPAAR